ncbi:hypothetical protein [Brucella sp. IR073]
MMFMALCNFVCAAAMLALGLHSGEAISFFVDGISFTVAVVAALAWRAEA